MSQSKKEALKTVRRHCRKASRTLTGGGLDLLILDAYIQLREDIEATVDALHRVPSGELQAVAFPVTYDAVDHLRTRLVAFQKSIDPAKHLL